MFFGNSRRTTRQGGSNEKHAECGSADNRPFGRAAAVVVAAKWIQQQGQGTGSRIAVATLDIQLGSRLTPQMIQMVEWPANSVPAGAFKDEAALADRVVKTTVSRGEPILENKLAPVGSRGGLSAVVEAGKRAITVRVNDVVGVAGFALPGNCVDIMVNTQEEGAKTNDKDRTISKIVLENILVLAVAQEAGRDETKPKVVNAVDAGSHPGTGREARPGTFGGNALAGAAQPDGSRTKQDGWHNQGNAAGQGCPAAATRRRAGSGARTQARPCETRGPRAGESGMRRDHPRCQQVVRLLLI